VTLIEFKLTTLAGFVLIPFGLFGKTAFMAERVLGNVVSSGIKLLVLAVIVGIGSTLFAEFTSAIPGEPTIEDALAIVLASLTLLGLGIFGPGIANGIVAGGPQLGAGAAAGTALLAGGTAASGIAGARLTAGAGVTGVSGAAQGTSRAAGAATMGYAMGSAGKSGGAAIAGGLAGAGRVAGEAALSPLRKLAASARSSFREGSRSVLDNRGAPAGSSSVEGPAPSGGPPAWARSMKQRQALGHSVSLALHTVRAGDGHGAGTSIDTREKD